MADTDADVTKLPFEKALAELETIVQRLEPPAGAADPSSERRAREIDAKDLRLPIERRVIAVFADQHLGKAARASPNRRRSPAPELAPAPQSRNRDRHI